MIDKLISIFESNNKLIAYVNGNESITYNELLVRANYYANLLKRQGSEPVIIYGNKSINMLISMIACLLSKRSYVMVSSNLPKERIKKIINITNTSLVIKNEEIENFNIPTIELKDLDVYKNDSIKENYNEIAYIVFTSGSTGEPKGVPISYDNLLNFISWISDTFKSSKHLNVLNTANFNFDLSVADIYYSLFNGHTLYSVNSFNYDDLFKTLINISMIVATPTFMRMCLLENDFNKEKFSNLEYIYCCGERLDVKLARKIIERFPDIKLFNAYGPTEATSAVCGIFINKTMLDEDILPVGIISKAATDIEIDNGEIILKGKSVFNGYLNYTGGYFNENGINSYRTGDLGYIKEGMLYCTGRSDNQIKYKGYRIELEEIESVISMIPDVENVAVVPIYDNGSVKTIKAFISGNVDKDEVINILKDKLPNYMIPKTIIILDKLPVNANGKIDRKKLCEI